MELECKFQNYEWGKRGSLSKVATLVATKNPNFEIDEKSPYAELWMGTHVNAPSIVKKTGETLASYIMKNPTVLGKKAAEIFDNQLPFLLKVLSVNKALSIQAHPTKEHAKELHSKRPDIYKDANHKPELAIALTPFEAMCGFRPIKEIKWFLQNIPELEAIIQSTDIEDEEEFLKQSFRAILTCDKQTITNTINTLIARYQQLDQPDRDKFFADIIERLNSQFPNDNGVLMIYFLNYIKLNPSESIYLGANEVHAYLFGDCIEIMASSDNVVRAGLTPKLVDVETLCSMLIYKGENPEDKKFKAVKEDEYTSVYKPPVQDFAVAEIRIPNSVKEYESIKRDSASIVIVVSGGADGLTTGSVVFLEANQPLKIKDISNEEPSILMYQGFTNV